MLGDGAKFIFVGMVLPLSVLIIANKLSWNRARIFGLLLYFFSVVSLVRASRPYGSSGAFDISGAFIEWFGRVPAILALIGIFLVSVYLTLRVSYRKIIGTIHANLPSVGNIKDSVVSVKNEIKEDLQKHKKEEEIARKKAELDAKIEAARLAREAEKVKETKVARQLKIEDAPQHIAIEKKER